MGWWHIETKGTAMSLLFATDSGIDQLGKLTGRKAAVVWDKRRAVLDQAMNDVFALAHPRNDVPFNTIVASNETAPAVAAYRAALASYYECEIDAGLRYGPEPAYRKRSLLEADKKRRIR
jgi:hypothetical protein